METLVLFMLRNKWSWRIIEMEKDVYILYCVDEVAMA